jgi:hypothetical protein
MGNEKGVFGTLWEERSSLQNYASSAVADCLRTRAEARSEVWLDTPAASVRQSIPTTLKANVL